MVFYRQAWIMAKMSHNPLTTMPYLILLSVLDGRGRIEKMSDENSSDEMVHCKCRSESSKDDGGYCEEALSDRQIGGKAGWVQKAVACARNVHFAVAQEAEHGFEWGLTPTVGRLAFRPLTWPCWLRQYGHKNMNNGTSA
jgi:hypothetical protein